MRHNHDPLKEVFNRYKENYIRRGNNHFRSYSEIKTFHLDRLPRWIDRIDKTARILDAGCATGYQLNLLRQAGYHNLTGVDISTELLEAAKATLPSEIALHQAEVSDFLAKTPDKSYDVILFHHVIEHIPRDQIIGLLREFRRCLDDNGYLSIKTPNAACLMGGCYGFGDITHLVHFNELSLLQVLELAGFAIEDIEFILHPPKLFWSWRTPLRSLMRLLNRLRWHINNLFHSVICKMIDLRPAVKVAELELEVLAKK